MSGTRRTIPTDQYLALLAANSPNGVNAIATLADVVGGSGGNQIISGTAAYSGAGLIYDVSTLVYTIQGTLYSSAPDTITVTSDPTFPKIVVFYADDTGAVGKIDGVPSASPVKPQVDSLTQVEVTFVTVPAGATSPGTTIELLYNENVGTGSGEWNTSATAPVNLSAVTDPYNGTIHIATTAAFGSNKNIIFTPSAPYLMAGGLLTFWMKAKSNMSTTTGKVLIGFFVGGSLVGNSVTIGGTPATTFGFSGSVIGTYQLVTIPISAFGGLPTNIDDLRLFTTAGPNTAEFDLDYVRILEGVATPPAPIEGHEIQDEGLPLTQRPILDFQGAGATVTDDPINNKTVVTIQGGGTSNLQMDSTGVLTGGVLSVGTGGPGVATTFSISDGTGQIVTAAGVKTPVSWTGLTDQALTFLATNLISFIAIDSAGSIVQSASRFTPQQARNLIILGVVVHVNFTTVDTVNNEQHISYNTMSSVYDGFESLGFFNVSGNVFSANGANMNINKSEGVLFKMGSNYDTDTNNPHRRTLAALTPAQFQYRFSDGTSGILTETNIDPNNLDDGAGGLTAVGSNRWSIQRIYCFTSNNVKIQRGVADYSTSTAAINAITTEAYVTEPSIAANGLFRGWLIVKQGATALNGSEAVFLSAGKLGEQNATGGGSGSGSSIQNNFTATTAPTSSNDNTQGYVVGSVWINLNTDISYTCVDASTGTAVWRVQSHIIEDEGTPLTHRNNVNFTGAGVTVTDAGGKTVVTIPGGGGSSKWNRGIWMYNVVGAAGYTWNGISVAAPTAAITSTTHPHRLFNFSGTNNQQQGFYFEQQLPSTYTSGANIRVTINVTALSATGGAVFYCGLTQPTAGNVLGGATETEWLNQTATFTGVTGYNVVPITFTFTGTNISGSDSLLFRVYRDPNNGADTLGTVGIVSISIEEI